MFRRCGFRMPELFHAIPGERHLVDESGFFGRSGVECSDQAAGPLGEIGWQFAGDDKIAAKSMIDSVAGRAGLAGGGDGAAGFGAVRTGDSAAAFGEGEKSAHCGFIVHPSRRAGGGGRR